MPMMDCRLLIEAELQGGTGPARFAGSGQLPRQQQPQQHLEQAGNVAGPSTILDLGAQQQP